MLVKNNSKRVITINFKESRVKIVPTRTATITAAQSDEIKDDVVCKALFKGGDLIEVKEKDALTKDIAEYFSIKELGDYYNIKELKEYTKSIEVDGYSNMDKDALLDAIKGEE